MSQIYLFTTSTCPQCPKAERWAKKVLKQKYTKIVLDKDKKGQKLAEKYDIRHVPAFLELKDGGTYIVYTLDEYKGDI
jgi:glutaredoxin